MKTMKRISILLISSSFWIIGNCQITFERTFGGFFNEYSHSVLQTDDNGFILCGFTSSFGSGPESVYVVKTDEYGNKLWDRTYGGAGEDHGYFINATNDGGYIICAESTSFGNRKAYLIRINSEGDTLWTNTYEGNNRSIARYVLQTEDNGFIVCGATSSTTLGPTDVFLFKTDENGNLMWSKTYGGTGSDFAYYLSQTQDGGFILCGGTRSFGNTNYDIYVIKTDNIGDTIWTTVIGGYGYNAGYSIVETESGHFIIGGMTSAFGANGTDILIVKLHENGEIIWTKNIDYYLNESGCHISLTSDEHIIGCGSTLKMAQKSDILVFKMDLDGNVLWINRFGGDEHDIGYSIFETDDLGMIITGYTQSYGAGMADMYLIKTNSDGLLTSIYEPVLSDDGINVFPNPCSKVFYIKSPVSISELKVIGVDGREFRLEFINNSWEGIEVDVTSVPKGVYVLKITNSKADYYKKLVIQ
jgi:hypothetical protein